MTAACACTTPTGSKGETLTFTRASSGTCLKGNVTSGIANGDLVTCSTDQPRVMPGGDGTGALGLLVEGARTNSTLRSEELDNAAWASNNSGASNPTVTADFGVAPDGTTTAERIQLPATTGAQFSERYQLSGCPGSGTVSLSFFAKSLSGTGTVDIVTSGSTAATCSVPAGSYTRCKAENFTTTTLVEIGHFSNLTGQARSADDLLVWGVQCEAGAFASSYIKTTSATVQRAADVGSFALSLTSSTISYAATWEAPSALASSVALHAYKDGNNSLKLSIASAKVRGTFRIGGSDSTQDTAGSATASASNAMAAYYDLTNKAACLGGTCTTASASLTLATGSHTLYLGADQAGANHAFGVIKKVCIDPSRCR